mgnify:FL=1
MDKTVKQIETDFRFTLEIIQNSKNNIGHIENIENCVNQFRRKYENQVYPETHKITKLQETSTILDWELSKLKGEVLDIKPTVEELIEQEPNNYSLGEKIRSIYGRNN